MFILFAQLKKINIAQHKKKIGYKTSHVYIGIL